MRKNLKKPRELTTQQTATALSSINNCLPLFPGGDENSKFNQSELLEILECSLPLAWRQKFDYEGYVPSDWGNAKLITSCEAIERNLNPDTGNKKQKQQDKKQEKIAKKKNKNTKHESKASKGDYHCSVQGQNTTHDSDNCYTLKNKAKAAGKLPAKPTFTNKGLRKE